MAAQPLNRKGEKVLAGLDVTGMEYTAAVRKIAECMIEKGYASDLNAKAEVDLDAAGALEGTQTLEADAVKVLIQVFKEHGMEAGIGTEERR